MERKPKLLFNGTVTYSFGKNGGGLDADTFYKVGEFLQTFSEDNYIVLADAIIDPLDDVYDLKFNIQPRNTADDWLVSKNDLTHAWYSTYQTVYEKLRESHKNNNAKVDGVDEPKQKEEDKNQPMKKTKK